MRSLLSLALTASALVHNVFAVIIPARLVEREAVVKPKVVIIDMFFPEGDVWYGIPEFDLNGLNVTVGGLSPVYGNVVHCTADGDICQITIGESEINAATTIASLVRSTKFDFTTTYFMVAGIAGVNPEVAGTNSVCFARFAVQVALQYEFSQLEIPSNFSYGYIPFGETVPNTYPTIIYGTEVFEFNQDLRHAAAELARTASLKDSYASRKYRENYKADPAYALGAAKPAVYECDVATSDVYYSGTILSTGFGNYTTVLTNGSGTYCTTAQEDNGTAEALLRAAVDKLVDFSRLIVFRTASDFDRPYPGESATTNLFYAKQGAFEPSVTNIYRAGVKVVMGIVNEWDSTFERGITPTNYIGDIFGTLGGTPDFGPYATGDPNTKRSLSLTRRSKLF